MWGGGREEGKRLNLKIFQNFVGAKFFPTFVAEDKPLWWKVKLM